ncbi:hypothetical protein ACFVU0_14060 [Streptomyces sp. NPDC058122]|uniref:hypothetical protein n=1 Tax=Streptomyces sp. NPDC058122 TaxID=3346349 RepID=UPI0036EE44DB
MPDGDGGMHIVRESPVLVPTQAVLSPELMDALRVRAYASGAEQAVINMPPPPGATDHLARDVLLVPRSERWRQAVSTAVLGNWCASLLQTGHLPLTALDVLKAQARTVHRELVPLWRRRTRHGRVLSLDASLGEGLSLHDLVATHVDLLAHTAGKVFENERLAAVLRGLNPTERAVVFAYAEGEGTTWTEAAAVTGALDPEAFGERVRRKAKRLAAEQRRRAGQSRTGPPNPR